MEMERKKATYLGNGNYLIDYITKYTKIPEIQLFIVHYIHKHIPSTEINSIRSIYIFSLIHFYH